MNAARLQDVMAWLRTTDLQAVRYHDGSCGFELACAPQCLAPEPVRFSNRYVPVCAPAVGVFQPQGPGQARLGAEGLAVAEGDALGEICTGVGRPHAVKAPCAGRVARVFIESGRPVEYGQPLFFLERT